MPDDDDTTVGALPVVRVYDRQDVERYLAAVEDEAAELERRLEAAQVRRSQAEQHMISASYQAGRGVSASPEVQAALSELEQVEEQHVATVAEIRAAAVADARRILTAAEREVVILRAALQGVLDELETGALGDPGSPFLSLAPELDATPEEDHRNHPSFGTVSHLRPKADVEAAPRLHAVGRGPSLAG